MKRPVIVLAALSALAATSGAAAQPLDAAELREYCSSPIAEQVTADAPVCEGYVSGFVADAKATDEQATRDGTDGVEQRETLVEDAMRTLLPRRPGVYPPPQYSEFCVGNAVAIARVAEHVLDEIERYDFLDDVGAQTVVIDALKRNYPCIVQPA